MKKKKNVVMKKEKEENYLSVERNARWRTNETKKDKFVCASRVLHYIFLNADCNTVFTHYLFLIPETVLFIQPVERQINSILSYFTHLI